jgi:hypothetical protein
MDKCWASSLGGCSDKITGEHIFTGGLFPQGELFVQGLHWCPNEPKLIGLANFTSNILCSTHNSGLSPADTAAIQTANSFREAMELRDFRARYKPTNWTRKTFKINGYHLESWFLKTLINVAYKGSLPIGPESTESGRPTTTLVEIAFGLRRFIEPAGLYAIATIGEGEAVDGKVRMVTLSTTKGYIGGAIFYFGGLKYLLYLPERTKPNPTDFVGPEGQKIQKSELMRHLRRAKFPVHGRLSHTIDFLW